MAFAKPATEPNFFGITKEHWRIVSEFAAERGYVIALRTGKKAAVPWIERRFPGKPLSLKIKVDRDVGLLIARDDRDRHAAWLAGYAVLERTDRAGEYVAMLGGGRDAFNGERFTDARHAWVREGLVIDTKQRLPLTSDYDLAAVVDTESFDYNLTYMSMPGAANRTNPLIAAVSSELNRKFGSPRILHGTEAQYSGSLAHGGDDEILIFHPAGDVEHVGPMPAIRTDRILHAIFERYFPDRAHIFRQ